MSIQASLKGNLGMHCLPFLNTCLYCTPAFTWLHVCRLTWLWSVSYTFKTDIVKIWLILYSVPKCKTQVKYPILIFNNNNTHSVIKFAYNKYWRPMFVLSNANEMRFCLPASDDVWVTRRNKVLYFSDYKTEFFDPKQSKKL